MSLKLEIKDGYAKYIIPPKIEKTKKGKSIIDFPDDYTVIYIETTEVGKAVEVRGKL